MCRHCSYAHSCSTYIPFTYMHTNSQCEAREDFLVVCTHRHRHRHRHRHKHVCVCVWLCVLNLSSTSTACYAVSLFSCLSVNQCLCSASPSLHIPVSPSLHVSVSLPPTLCVSLRVCVHACVCLSLLHPLSLSLALSPSPLPPQTEKIFLQKSPDVVGPFQLSRQIKPSLLRKNPMCVRACILRSQLVCLCACLCTRAGEGAVGELL
mmetsp:Transcript_75828/g.123122  ORF Transcript_75828/g.123122 Transcript_75828/m.123122 type:complete len:207 (+) Transcript_75828:192-812(+)